MQFFWYEIKNVGNVTSLAAAAGYFKSHLFKESVGLKMRSLRGVGFATAQCCTKCKTT